MYTSTTILQPLRCQRLGPPYRPKADIWLTGHAYPPGGRRATGRGAARPLPRRSAALAEDRARPRRSQRRRCRPRAVRHDASDVRDAPSGASATTITRRRRREPGGPCYPTSSIEQAESVACFSARVSLLALASATHHHRTAPRAQAQPAQIGEGFGGTTSRRRPPTSACRS